MHYVLQTEIGWVGLTNGKVCTNGVVEFELTDGIREQLKQVLPRYHELNCMIKHYKVRFKDDKYGFLKRMEADLNELNRKSKESNANRTRRR